MSELPDYWHQNQRDAAPDIFESILLDLEYELDTIFLSMKVGLYAKKKPDTRYQIPDTRYQIPVRQT